MADHPASDPAKPGSKLASMQALGRRGGVVGQEEKLAPSPGHAKQPGKAAREGKLSPAVKRLPRKRVTKPKVKTVKKAKAVLKRAEKAAKAKKPGPQPVVGQPWKKAGVSKTTYYRHLKSGATS